MIALSVLDLAPVVSGSSPAEAVRRTVDLAQHAEAHGFARYWLAEHHNSAGIASSSPEILIAHVAMATKTIRVGSGGVMLPNHAPLRVAESFSLLEAFHPGRIDLGLGRAPGTDKMTALALRGSRDALTPDNFPEQLTELRAFLADDFPAGNPLRRVHVSPTLAAAPPIWLLGSSEFSGRLAAAEGLGFAFAHHINPTLSAEVMTEYREMYKPSSQFPAPHSILAVSVICAETDERARELAKPMELMWLRVGRGERGPLPSVEEAQMYKYDDDEIALVAFAAERGVVGSPATVKAKLEAIAGDARADEIMILTLIHDHEARKNSYALVAEAFGTRGHRDG